MAKTYSRLSRHSMRALARGQVIREHGIEFNRLPDGDGVFTVNVMVERRRIHRIVGRESDGTTRTQVEEFIEKLRQDAKNDRLALPKGRKVTLSFSEAADRYLTELTRAGGKDLKEKRRRLALHLVPYFGQMQLSRIDSLSIERYKEKRRVEPTLRGGVRRGANASYRRVAKPSKMTTGGTINRELAVLSHLLNCAVRWGWIASMPVKVCRFPEPPTRFEYLTEKEVGILLAAAERDGNPHVYAFVFIALHTGMRMGEVLSLRREFIEFEKLRIHLPKTKTGARDVPMSPKLKEYLEQWRPRNADNDWLFPSATSESGHIEDVTKAWRRIVEAAGLGGRRLTPHTMRHTAITHLVQAGVDLPTVQRISGHKSFQMVFRYAHQNQDHVQDALRKLDRRLGTGSADRDSAIRVPRDYTGITQRGGLSATRTRRKSLIEIGRPCQTRTGDQRIKSPLLYHLS